MICCYYSHHFKPVFTVLKLFEVECWEVNVEAVWFVFGAWANFVALLSAASKRSNLQWDNGHFRQEKHPPHTKPHGIIHLAQYHQTSRLCVITISVSCWIHYGNKRSTQSGHFGNNEAHTWLSLSDISQSETIIEHDSLNCRKASLGGYMGYQKFFSLEYVLKFEFSLDITRMDNGTETVCFSHLS